jgi:hypothetical protein
MKALLSVAAVLVLSAAPAVAGQGQVSKNSLAKMGLAGMQVMSDEQGSQIRGTSVAVVFGISHATISGEGGSASSTNGYFAAGHHSASGANVSFAATADIDVNHGHVSVDAEVVAAGGFSTAHAH